MTPNHDFTNAKVGDKIYTVQWGEGTIVEVKKVNQHSICAEFKDTMLCTFTEDGKNTKFDSYPTAFTEPIKVVSANHEPFQEQEMMVWNIDIEDAAPRVVVANVKDHFIAHVGVEYIQDIHLSVGVCAWKKALPKHEWEAKVKESKNQKEITEIEFQIAELQAKLEKLKG